MNPTNEDLMDILLCWLSDSFQEPHERRAAIALLETLRVNSPLDERRKALLASIRERNERDNYAALFGEEKAIAIGRSS